MSRRAGGTVVATVGVVTALAAFGTLGAVLTMGTDEPEPVQARIEVTDVREGEVPPEAYSAVSLGVDKETLTQRLLPARAVDSRVLSRYQLRAPETVASSCVYYESEAPPADDLYRFCFAQDRLIEKTFVLPEADQPGG